MERGRSPSFVATSAVVIILIVIPLGAATLTAALVKEWVSVGLVLLYSLTLLLIVIPYFALASGQVASNTWLRTYLEVLNRIPLLQPIVGGYARYQGGKDLAGQIESIVHSRIQASDWKKLHQDCQSISLKLTVLLGIAATSDYPVLLHDLEYHWSFECSGMIFKFSRLDILASESVVRADFSTLEHSKRWLDHIQSAAEALDELIGRCVTVVDLQNNYPQLRALIFRLERITSEILSYVDSRLQASISELDTRIEAVRASVMRS